MSLIHAELVLPVVGHRRSVAPLNARGIDEVDVPGELAASWEFENLAVRLAQILVAVPVLSRSGFLREQLAGTVD